MATVLVVDDNEKIVEVLAEYLAAAGHTAVTALDGDAALLRAAEARPDLALVDVMLPGIDGLDLTKRFQAQGIPVILVTARGDEVDRLVGLEIGADDYITKPFSPREVVARVKAVLRRCSRERDRDQDDAPPLVVGDLSIDPERREVRVQGVVVDLTRTEFDILYALAGHPGRVYTRLQLLEIASGDAFDGYERTVDAHVKNIRRKLGEDSKNPRYVKTVFGVGYKLEA
ncbi:MAG: response regulator transcription factor [Actinomycetota bacterium]|nr:response regulator transcription factor [Actinomycetota bacterium]